MHTQILLYIEQKVRVYQSPHRANFIRYYTTLYKNIIIITTATSIYMNNNVLCHRGNFSAIALLLPKRFVFVIVIIIYINNIVLHCIRSNTGGDTLLYRKSYTFKESVQNTDTYIRP